VRRNAVAFTVTASSSSTSSADEEVLREVAVTGLPILGAALSEPLLTLVDTAFVGRGGSTLALAALSINCAFYNFLSNSTSWLVTAGTNTVAASLAADNERAAGGPTSRLLGHLLLLALVLGVPAAAAVLVWPDALLSLYGAPPGGELAAAARSYLVARALSVPSVLLMFAAVGACLGAGSAAAPSAAIALAALVNVLGDAVLVPWLGLAGAAAATAAASWTGTLFVLSRLRGLVAPARLSAPSGADAARLLAVSGVLLLAQLTSSTLYSLTTQRAAAAGTAAAAAHQIQLQIWWLLSYFPVPLYLAAQTMLGRALGRGDGAAAQATVRVLLRLGAALALALGAVNAAAPMLAAPAFSADAQVLACVHASLPAAAAAQVLASANTVLEGVFAGCGRLRHIAAVSLLSAAVGAAAMFAAPRAWGLAGPWVGLLVFEAVRTAAHAAAWPGFQADLAAGRLRGAAPRAEAV